VCFQAFGDRVKFWTTFNEPNLFTKFAYMLGMYPPSHCSAPFGTCNSGNSHREPYVAAHNIIMSHAAAVDNYKKNYQAKQGGSIGIVIAMKFYEPLTNATEDILAAQRALSFEIHWYVIFFTSFCNLMKMVHIEFTKLTCKRGGNCSLCLCIMVVLASLFAFCRFLDPIFFGEYPKEMHEVLSSNLPKFTAAEKRLLQNKVDFIGVNHYTTIYAKDCILSSCDLNTYEGNALVLAIGERDGVKIGKPVRTCFSRIQIFLSHSPSSV
jgi:beta-glucosidase